MMLNALKWVQNESKMCRNTRQIVEGGAGGAWTDIGGSGSWSQYLAGK